MLWKNALAGDFRFVKELLERLLGKSGDRPAPDPGEGGGPVVLTDLSLSSLAGEGWDWRLGNPDRTGQAAPQADGKGRHKHEAGTPVL